MTEEQIRARFEAVGDSAAGDIAAEFERLKPAPWKERLGDWWYWWCCTDKSALWLCLFIVGVITIVVWLSAVDVRLKREYTQESLTNIELCDDGSKVACLWLMENGSEEGKAIARKRL